MRSLEVRLNGAPTGEGFVIVSHPNQLLPAMLNLHTTDGSEADVALRSASDSAAALTITPNTVHVSGTPVAVQVLAATPSESRNDTAVEVVQGEDIVRFELTSLAAPRVRFSGRFQVRLATDGNPFDHPWGFTTGPDGSFFRMYAVEGADPLNPHEPPLDRIIRFQDEVALRPHCRPSGVTIRGIEADVGGAELRFEQGDPVIGLAVRLGPRCRFEEQDGDFAFSTFQPIADFRLEIGLLFAGESEPALKRLSPTQPPPSNAPYADGAFFLDEIGPWEPRHFGYPEATWAAHAQAVVTNKLECLRKNEPADRPAHRIWERRIAEHESASADIAIGLQQVQRFSGEIDREVQFSAQPMGTLAYLETLPSIPFYAEFFDFDSDCQGGTVTGTLGLRDMPPADLTSSRLDPAVARSGRP